MQVAQARPKRGGALLLVILAAAGLALACLVGMVVAAVPAFLSYVTRAKTAEAETNLRRMYEGAAAYYASTGCTVASAVTPNTPGSSRAVLGPLPESFGAIGFEVADPVYYQYEIVSAPGCNRPAGMPLYTFRAHGDLDGDGHRSLYELTASSGRGGELVSSPTVTAVNELE